MKKLLIIGAILIITGGLIATGLAIQNYFAIGQNPSFTNLNEPRDLADQTGPADETAGSPVDYQIEPFVSDLEVPWDLVFTGEGRALVTERAGRIRVIQDGQLQEQPLHSFPEVSSQAEEGLMGMALHPDYQTNSQIYACYAYPTDTGLAARVIRFVDNGASITQIETILDDIPAARFHAGCRVRFGPDGMLYVTTGDATNKEIAQDLESLGGKILRMTPEGAVPVDNPFPDSLVYSYGHRNAQGIDWHPNGLLYSSEHGPSVFDGPAGGDEINIIRAGENYGWPIVSHQESQEGMVDPLLIYTPAIAPGSLEVYTGDQLPQFTNNIFVGMLRGEGVLRVAIDENDPQTVLVNEPLRQVQDYGRIRTVVEGPEGYLYVMTSNQDGRGQPRPGDDHIYRLMPEQPE